MKEVTFIRRNIEKWKETEKVVERAASLSPDQLADAYTDLTADLAFAQTHFPTSRITICLLYTSPSPRDRSLSRMPSSA